MPVRARSNSNLVPIQMNSKTLIIFLLGLVMKAAAVEPPKSFNSNRYYHLFRESIVTNKPDPIVVEEEKSDLEDWVLVGSRNSVNGQLVTIVNSKDQSQRINIPSKEATELGFAILEVKHNSGNFMRTEAHLQKGGFRGWVKYDQKFLTLKRPTAKKANPPRGQKQRPRVTNAGKKNRPPIPGLTDNRTRQNNSNKKRARVRYVPKPKK